MNSATASNAEDISCSQFRPSRSFKFPKHSFGGKGLQQLFWLEWCQKYNWLHYDVGKNAAFCYLCMQAEHEKSF